MPALNFIITNAGLDLLSQVGTIGPVTLTKVAIGSAGYTPTAAATALTTQIKQITPEGSSVPSTGMIHITASDKSTDAYTVKEIGLYAGTTLFAIYSQTAAILTKASGNVALFSIDLALTNVPAGSVTIGNASFEYPPATETVKGVAEIATQAEVNTGDDDERIVTSKKLAAGYVKKSGDTMTGRLTLSADPTSSLHAAPKQYVDAADAMKVAKAGDTMTGLLTLSADPTAALHAATKQYVDGTVSFSANGYQRLPSGLLLQWGRTANNVGTGNSSQSALFPIAFPTVALNVTIGTLTSVNSGNQAQLMAQLYSFTNTGFVWVSDAFVDSGINPIGIHYVAIGY